MLKRNENYKLNTAWRSVLVCFRMFCDWFCVCFDNHIEFVCDAHCKLYIGAPFLLFYSTFAGRYCSCRVWLLISYKTNFYNVNFHFLSEKTIFSKKKLIKPMKNKKNKWKNPKNKCLETIHGFYFASIVSKHWFFWFYWFVHSFFWFFIGFIGFS